MRPLALPPDGIVDLVRQAVAAGGGWSMGVQGAVAEFAVAPGAGVPVVGWRSPRTVEVLTAGGGLRLTITGETCAFAVTDPNPPAAVLTVYLAVPRRTLPRPPAGVAVAEADPGALRPGDRGHLLADLAVGHAAASFCVRTGDPELGQLLRKAEGASWPEALDLLGHELVAASPHRVVTTPLGRIEVYSPIPPKAGASPDGPHTHLLPALLRSGRELPAGLELPADLAPAAAFHPPAGWTPPS